jgi:hypothetical protein
VDRSPTQPYIGELEQRSRPAVQHISAQRAGAAQTAAMQGSGALPGLTGTGRGGGFLPCGSLGKRTPAGRRGATSVRAVDGASVAAAASAAADSPLPPVQVTWQIAVGALGRSVFL